MASSKVNIINRALIMLGQEPIASESEKQPTARFASARFDSARDVVLRGHRWNCAMKRATLNELTAEVPAFGFSKAFQLPPDFIRLSRMSDTQQVFRIEGDQLLTDQATAEIVYVHRVEDPNLFDAECSEAIACRLAYELAPKFAPDRANAMGDKYTQVMADAQFVDSDESPNEIIIQSSVIDAMDGHTHGDGTRYVPPGQ